MSAASFEARGGGAAAQQHEAQSQSLRLLEQQRGRIVVRAWLEQVVMVRRRGATRAQQFHQADARGHPQPRFVEAAPIGEGHGLQPGAERGVDAGRHPLQQRLEQMMVGIDPARIDDAVRLSR
ncbi:hypothetical protein J2739_004382 [Variovorax soli]|uniref:Uncharacterized protein n=1 Tax=Variovorax soli TaxID=376815 RepID=A0ABU1NJG2_9BURK|nr:hypothetical protein [Variovorax soli]